MKLKGLKMRIGILLLGFLLFLIPTLSFTQEFPTKPINIRGIFQVMCGVTVRILANRAKFLGQLRYF
jgi:hypothetical protein